MQVPKWVDDLGIFLKEGYYLAFVLPGERYLATVLKVVARDFREYEYTKVPAISPGSYVRGVLGRTEFSTDVTESEWIVAWEEGKYIHLYHLGIGFRPAEEQLRIFIAYPYDKLRGNLGPDRYVLEETLTTTDFGFQRASDFPWRRPTFEVFWLPKIRWHLILVNRAEYTIKPDLRILIVRYSVRPVTDNLTRRRVLRGEVPRRLVTLGGLEEFGLSLIHI